jgi:hypothetical protein
LIRYRRHRGVNLGAWFTTEGWLNVNLYKDVALDPKGSDFDLARSKNAAAMEHHWDTWITEEDWQWMKERGFNSVRLPVSIGAMLFGTWDKGCSCGCQVPSPAAERAFVSLNSGLRERRSFAWPGLIGDLHLHPPPPHGFGVRR